MNASISNNPYHATIVYYVQVLNFKTTYTCKSLKVLYKIAKYDRSFYLTSGIVDIQTFSRIKNVSIVP